MYTAYFQIVSLLKNSDFFLLTSQNLASASVGSKHSHKNIVVCSSKIRNPRNNSLQVIGYLIRVTGNKSRGRKSLPSFYITRIDGEAFFGHQLPQTAGGFMRDFNLWQKVFTPF